MGLLSLVDSPMLDTSRWTTHSRLGKGLCVPHDMKSLRKYTMGYIASLCSLAVLLGQNAR